MNVFFKGHVAAGFDVMKAKVDEDMLSAMLEMYYYNVPKHQHSKIFKKIENQLFGIKKLDFID